MELKVYAVVEHYVRYYTEVMDIERIAKEVYNPIKQRYNLDVALTNERKHVATLEYKVTITVYEDRLQEDQSR